MTLSSNPAVAAPRAAVEAPATLRRTVARHSGVVSAQVLAGAGNLVFSIAAVRLLTGPQYAHFAAFLAAYLLLNTPAASLTAGASLRPDLAARLARPLLAVGLATGAGIAAAAPWISVGTNLPVPLVLLLAADAPAAGLLALVRGGLFGRQRLVAAGAGIVAEPAVRCAVGLALVPVAGTTGAGVGVVAGGYASLALCWLLGRRSATAGPAQPRATQRPAAATVLSFLLLAVVGALDVILGNRVLPAEQAGTFAAASTLGGAVLFATATVPLLQLAPGRNRGALGAALGVSLVASVAGALALLLLPVRVLALVLGDRAGAVRAVLPAYLAAMVLLCLARVLVAALCRRGRARASLLTGLAALGVQVTLLLPADTAQQAARATLAASAVLLAGTALLSALPQSPAGHRPAHSAVLVQPGPEATLAPVEPAAASRSRRRRDLWRRADLTWVLAACAVAVGVRLATDRSVWIDEAISVHEASQPFGQMLDLLRTTDVHPPLYFTLLWAVIHATGSTTETVVRLASLVPGVVLVAVAYAAARDFWDRRTARYAAAIAAIGPAAVWYSQDARMYALFMLFALTAAWMVIRILRAGRWRDVAVLALSCAALTWTQYHSTLTVATLFVVLAAAAVTRVVRERRWRLLGQTLAAAAFVVAAFLPLVPWVLQQYGHTSGLDSQLPSQAGQSAVAHTGVNVYSVLANLVWALFGYHSDHAMLLINAFWPALLLFVLVSLGRGRSTEVRVLVAMAAVPAMVLFVIAQKRTDMFDLRYFAPTVPALNLLVARIVASWPRGRLTRALVPAVTALALVAGLVDEQANSSNPRVFDFRGAVAYVRAHSQPGDVLLYGPSFLQNELLYYRPELPTQPIQGPQKVTTKGRVFVLGSFLTQRGPAALVGSAVSTLDQTRHLVRKIHFPNVTIWEYR